MRKLIYFPYTTEIFILLNLFLPNPVSWWWVGLFILSDFLDVRAFKDSEMEKKNGK